MTTCRLHAWNVPDGLRCPECVFESLGHTHEPNSFVHHTGAAALEEAIKIVQPSTEMEFRLRTIAHLSGYWAAIKQAREMQRR